MSTQHENELVSSLKCPTILIQLHIFNSCCLFLNEGHIQQINSIKIRVRMSDMPISETEFRRF